MKISKYDNHVEHIKAWTELIKKLAEEGNDFALTELGLWDSAMEHIEEHKRLLSELGDGNV